MWQQQQNKAPTPSEAGPCWSDQAPCPVPQSTSCSGRLGSALRAQNVQFRLSSVKGAVSSLLSAKPWLVLVTTTRTSLQLGSGGTRLTLREKHWFLGRPPRHSLGGPPACRSQLLRHPARQESRGEGGCPSACKDLQGTAKLMLWG